jgi:NADPH:quinone reductase-like Zn-dependent oxidoreductase
VTCPDPEPGPGQVLVRLATTVNTGDVRGRAVDVPGGMGRKRGRAVVVFGP